MTKLIINRDIVSGRCGNRGGVDKSMAYAAAKAVAKTLGNGLAVFSADQDDLVIAEWAYAPGTHRAEPTNIKHSIAVQYDDALAEACIAMGDHADACHSAMVDCLERSATRIERRNGPVASSDPIDVGFDARLHRTM